jgi:hypothetical protein
MWLLWLLLLWCFWRKKVRISSRTNTEKRLEEDDYNENNRKRVMTAHQIVKFLTGEIASNSLIPLQVQF